MKAFQNLSLNIFKKPKEKISPSENFFEFVKKEYSLLNVKKYVDEFTLT